MFKYNLNLRQSILRHSKGVSALLLLIELSKISLNLPAILLFLMMLNLITQLFSPFILPYVLNLPKFLNSLTLRLSLNQVINLISLLLNPPIPEFRKWDTYKVPCKDCNLFYIGQFQRNLKLAYVNIYAM